jgi:hypothetical protein
MLLGEEWLLGDLIFCRRCLKFKPSATYDTFPYEQMMLKKYNKGVQRWGEKIIDLYWNQCRRCRTKDILVSVGIFKIRVSSTRLFNYWLRLR